MTRVWPGFDMNGMTLAELRAKVRGKEGVGDLPPPSGKRPERLGNVLRRMQEKGELPRVKAE